MIRIRNCKSLQILLVAFVLALACTGYAQDANSPAQSQSKADTVQVPAGQKINIEGVILYNQQDNLIVRSLGGAVYIVTTENAQIKEKKSNPFRGAKKYSKSELVSGLHVEVKGTGSHSGSLSAREIKCTNDDFKMAQTMDSRVVPVENQLSATQTRLSETEQNARRLSGQIQELSVVSNAARGGAKAAQETADNAMLTANNARTLADEAKAGAHAANERIASLDDYDVKQAVTVHFKVGSAILSKNDIEDLEKLAEAAKREKGFVIEVAGFASADGDQAYNRHLSHKRADAVIQYFAENHSIPLRRFVTPMGYGESQPVADNHTREGRKENRRVEVRILVSKGLTFGVPSSTTDTTMNMPAASR
jgi:outer membrane protein OmpA-like peptidoglycan-associated protein